MNEKDKSLWLLIAFVVTFFFFVAISIYFIREEINSAGGIKQIIIEAGKDVKDIATEISKHGKK